MIQELSGRTLNLSAIAALTTQQGNSFLGAMKYAMLIHAILTPTYALAADCHGPRFEFCKNCDTQISLTVDKNVGCTLFIHRSEGYEALNIVGRPKHGKVGIDSRPRPGKKSYAAHISYVPVNGFSGIDSYVLHAVFFSGAGQYETNAYVTLNVR